MAAEPACLRLEMQLTSPSLTARRVEIAEEVARRLELH